MGQTGLYVVTGGVGWAVAVPKGGPAVDLPATRRRGLVRYIG